MDITFSAKDGFCPWFKAPNGDVYIIQDHRVGVTYEYDLLVKNRKPETLTFETEKEVDAYIKAKTDRRRFNVVKSDGKTAYLLYDVTIVCKELTITLFYTPNPIAENFEFYDDCLNFAKEYIAKEIEMSARKQINLFELEASKA